MILGQKRIGMDPQESKQGIMSAHQLQIEETLGENLIHVRYLDIWESGFRVENST